MSKFNYSRSQFKAALCGLLLLPMLAHSEEEPRWYQVEVIVFSQNSPAYHQSENWPLDYTLPDLQKSRELVKPKGADKKPPAEPFSLVDDGRLQLGETAARIKRAGDLELVLHLGWIQPGLEQSKSVPVHIYEGMLQPNASSGTATVNPRLKLDGTLRLSLSRYLHLESDLVWREPLPASLSDFAQETMPVAHADSSATTGAEVLPEGVLKAAGPGYQVFRMQQSSRMRSNEIHYQDHPLFGIIAVVTRYEPTATNTQ